MLSRFAVDPVPHLALRLPEVKRIAKQSGTWGLTREKHRRNAGYRRFVLPARLRLALDKGKGKPKAITNNMTRLANPKIPVRKAKKRKLKRVLIASHVWSTKRMRMDRSSWFGMSVALRSTHRNPEANVKLCLEGSGVHDASYETWFRIEANSEALLTEFLAQVLDPNDIPTESELSGTRFVLHAAGEFPSEPICPVRILMDECKLHVRLAVHGFCLEAVESALRCSVSNISADGLITVRRLHGISTFILVGPKCAKACERVIATAGSANANLTELSAKGIPCPLFGMDIALNEFGSYFYGGDFGRKLTYGGRSFAMLDSIGSVASQGIPLQTIESHKFSFGRKQSRLVAAELLLVDQHNNDSIHQKNIAQLWTRLSRAVNCALGVADLEHLLLKVNSPSFPRDYPDTLASKVYWENQYIEAQNNLLKLPRSKRGSKNWPNFRPEWTLVSGVSFDGAANSIAVARGWHNLSFFFDPDAIGSEFHPNLVVRVQLMSPHSSRFGARLSNFMKICLPESSDYRAFCEDSADKTSWRGIGRAEGREVVGLISSSFTESNQSFGIGHITVEGLVALLAKASNDKRKQRKRRLFVLVKDEENWGVAFLSVVA